MLTKPKTIMEDETPAKKSELDRLEVRQIEADNRLVRLETSLESLTASVQTIANTIAESHKENKQGLNQVHAKLDNFREVFANSRGVLWGPIIAALMAGAGFVTMVVLPVRESAARNDAALKRLNQHLMKKEFALGVLTEKTRRNELRGGL